MDGSRPGEDQRVYDAGQSAYRDPQGGVSRGSSDSSESTYNPEFRSLKDGQSNQLSVNDVDSQKYGTDRGYDQDLSALNEQMQMIKQKRENGHLRNSHARPAEQNGRGPAARGQESEDPSLHGTEGRRAKQAFLKSLSLLKKGIRGGQPRP